MTGHREFIGLVAACVVTAPLDARAQPAAKLPRVALVFPSVPLVDMVGPDPVDRNAREFVHRLRELGHVEGRNISIERRSAEGQLERLPVLMKELVELRVDVIVTVGNGAHDAQLATSTIPIVVWIDDPVAVGLTSNLGRPTRNVTGVSGTTSPAIHGKRLQLLKEAAPKSLRVAAIDFKYVDSIVTPGTHLRRLAAEAAARDLGVKLIAVGVDNPEDFEQAFAAIVRERADALIDMGTPNNFAHRRRIIDFAARQRLPAIYARREFPEAGGLMSYAPSELPGGRMAVYVDSILKGAKPSDLPFEQPTKFELVINLKTAARLGLAIPQSLLLAAEVVV
jgi:ABC-type uncharacterized transport system substrate-binding protein